MKKVILTSNDGETIIGTLVNAVDAIKIDQRLSAAFGAGNFSVGIIETPTIKFQALFTVETEPNEDEPEEKSLHEQWMCEKGIKPGDAIGMAIDANGKIYRFKSA